MFKLLTTILILSYCQPVLGQLTARFTADQTGGCGPLVVHFSNQTTGAGAAASYQWDLGNGNSAVVADPVATYTQPGTFTVLLTVLDGSQSSTFSQVITVYAPPTASFNVVNPKVCNPMPVEFNATAVAGSGAIANYLWDFGDGNTATVMGTSAAHVYSAGTYGVNLTVTDIHGCVATAAQANAVTVLPAVVPSFSINPQVLCTVNSPVTFSNTTTGPGTLNYQWNFGDGGASMAANPTYTYAAKGTYTVILTATSSAGCVAADTQTNVLNVANFQTDFTVPASVCLGASSTFNDSSSPAPTNEAWVVDGVAAGAGMTLGETFGAGGNHTITLTNTYGSCTQSVTHRFAVNTPPVMPPFDAVQQSSCGAPLTMNFTDNTPGAVQWAWAFYYNGYSSAQNLTYGGPTISFSYPEDADYLVQLTVTNAAGCQASEIQTVVVTSPVAGIYVAVGGPPVCGQPITETFASADMPNLSSWEWIFGDGDSSNAQSPTHTFTNQGAYQIYLKWTDKNGCSGVSNTLYVDIWPPINADFTASATTVCAGQLVTLIPTGIPVNGYLYSNWDFGDGSPYTDFAPSGASHAYNTPGVYDITLYVGTTDNCTEVVTKNAYITVLPSPTINFTEANTCDSPRAAVTFNLATGNGATSVQWQFGDGATLDTAAGNYALVHTYNQNDFYTVSATATNGTCSTSTEVGVVIELKPLAFHLGLSATNICPATFIWDTLQQTFPPGSTYDFYAFSAVQWYYSDGTPFLGPQNWVSIGSNGYYSSELSGFQPGETGLYAVTSNGTQCKDTSNIVPLVIGGVTAAFQIIQDDQCYQQPVILQDMSQAAGDPIVSWLWDFGDGIKSTASGTVQHIYASPGTYTVTLTVTDQGGCSSATSSTVNQVTVNGPKAMFQAQGGAGYPAGSTVFPQGSTVQFVNNTNTANTTNVSYTWTFGDGTSSTQVNPAYLYALAGPYTVTLTAQDGVNGCVSAATLNILIEPVNNAFSKIASYVASGSCPPVFVQFTNTSQNYQSFTWNFGDGETVSNVADPSHVYQNPGTYIVTLTVLEDNGQTTTTIDSVVVLAPAAALAAAIPAICVGQSDTLRSTGNTRVKNFAWDFGDGTVVSGPDSTTGHVYATAGVYQARLVVTDSVGCSVAAVATDAIDVHAPPIVGMTPPVALVCLGSGVTISAIGGVTYSWSPGASLNDSTISAPVATPSVYTVYTVMVADNIGCTNSDSIGVRVVRPDTVQASPDSTAICPGKEVQLTAMGAYSYQWIGGGLSATNIPNPVAKPAVTTVYQVAGRDSASCFQDTASVIVTLLVAPMVNAGPDLQVQSETPTTIAAVGSSDVVSWQWAPATDLSCTTCAQPVCTPRRDEQYIVTVTAADGCVASDTVVVTLICDEAKVRIPDAFTPNGDGHNDRFTVLGAIPLVNRLVIFDRWGAKVFEEDNFGPADPNAGWDGKMGGKPAPAGVYVYFAEMQCPTGGVFMRKGTVVLVR